MGFDSTPVAVGPYRYVRNPMISAVAAMLSGEALVFGSALPAGRVVVFVLVNHVYRTRFPRPGSRWATDVPPYP